MKPIDNYKLMSTNELIEKDRRFTEILWRIANEITMEDGLVVYEKSTDLLEAISDQIKVIEDLMINRTDLLEWPKSIIKIYISHDKLVLNDRR